MVGWRNIVSYIPAVGILMVMAALPYEYGWIRRIGLYTAGLGYLLDAVVNARWREWKWSRDKWVYVAFIAFYLCIPVRQLFDPNQTWLYWYKLREYVPFIIIGGMGFCQMPTKLKTEYVAWTMLASCCYMGIVLLIAMWGHSAASWTDWLADLNRTRTERINTHMSVNFYCNIALIFGTWTLIHSNCRRWLKVLTAVVMGFVVVGILLSEGRTGQLTMLVLMLALGAVYMWQHHRRWFAPVLTLLIVFVAAVYYLNPRYHEPSAKHNPRLYIWHVGLETAKAKPLFGWGVSSGRIQFVANGKADKDFCAHYMNEYEQISRDRFGEVTYDSMHPHNVFLETTIEFGLVGLLILLLCVILPLCLLPIGIDRYYLAACVFVFVMQATFEIMGRDLSPLWLPLLTVLWHYIYCTKNLNN